MSTIAQVNAEAEVLDRERLELRQAGKEIAAKRREAVVARELQIWGLTADEYAACKLVVEKPRQVLRTHAELLNRRKKLQAKIANPKFTAAARAAFEADLANVTKQLADAADEVQRVLGAPQASLWQLLNQARVAKGLPTKNVTVATVVA